MDQEQVGGGAGKWWAQRPEERELNFEPLENGGTAELSSPRTVAALAGDG